MGFRDLQEQAADLCQQYGGIQDPARWVMKFPNGAELPYFVCMNMTGIDDLKDWLKENVINKPIRVTYMRENGDWHTEERTSFNRPLALIKNSVCYKYEESDGPNILYVES